MKHERITSWNRVTDKNRSPRYIPSGTSKFGVFTIENIAGQSTLQYRLFIDGRERWETVVLAPTQAASDNPLASLWSKIKGN